MEVTSSCLMCAACLVLVIAVLGGVGYVTYTHTYFWMKYPALDWEYKNLAIVCSSGRCADIAMRIITESKGGLGDAAVAALACMGVLLPHKTGLGGGLLALYYNSTAGDVEALDALGKTPIETPETWFWQHADSTTGRIHGRPAAIVPGAVSGYEYLHRRLGRLNWDTLFEPAINIAKEGFPVDKHLADALKRKDSVINADTKMRMLYWNHSTKAWKTVGDAINNDFLAKTLTQIAENGDRHFYSGRLAEDLVEDLRRGGSLVDIADFAHYRAHWSPTIKHTMAGGKKFHAPPVPGVGALLKVLVSDFALRQVVLVPKGGTPELPSMSGAELHRLVETLKFSFARKSDLGDSAATKARQNDLAKEIMISFKSTFDNQDPLPNLAAYKASGPIDTGEYNRGGAFLALRDRTGDALAIASSLNNEFGSGYVTMTGIIMNDYMNAFLSPVQEGNANASLGSSLPNKVGSLKSPITAMIPAIITNGKALHAVLGDTGGLRGISSVAQLVACVDKFTLFTCVKNNVPVHPNPEGDNFVVQVGAATTAFNPEELLRKYNHQVVSANATLLPTASGILSSGRDTWLAVAAVNDTNGGVAGTLHNASLLPF